MDYNIFKEFSKFNNIKFYDSVHTYFIGDQQVISVTGLIHKFVDEFDEKKWLNIKGEELATSSNFKLNNESHEDSLFRAMSILKNEWTFKNRHGIYEGTLIHKYLENLIANKDVEEDKSGVDGIVTFEDIEKTFFMMKRLVKNFYDDYVKTGILVPVKSELVVGSINHKIAGQIDQLFFDTRINCLVPYDWKTNRILKTASEYKMKHCLNHLESCELNTYSLQLHTYKYLLESQTGIKLHPTPNIVWFNEHNDKPEIIPCVDMTKEVKMMFDFKKDNEEMFNIKAYTRPEIPLYKIEKTVSMADLLNF